MPRPATPPKGRTVDTSLILVDGPTDSRGIYTAMTRGREANHAYVVTEDNETGLDLLGLAVTRDWVDHPAIARRDQLDPHRPRELEPLHPGEEDSRERMMRRARQRIIERQEQRRRVEPTLGRGTLAAAYDLKVFFSVRGQGSGGCGPADVLEFITAQRR